MKLLEDSGFLGPMNRLRLKDSSAFRVQGVQVGFSDADGVRVEPT